ncbi:MAG: ABC transporter substrate-binding protein [Verrucomicrobia bacterium]|nr:ABC transporter substrate-binding protein [Verrucomicrobiota bacterium]
MNPLGLFTLQRVWYLALLVTFGAATAWQETIAAESAVVLRVGHFPHLTHAQALAGRALARQGRPWFEKRLGSGVKLEWYVYNSGATAMEALLSKSIDLAYAGPTPPINAYVRMKGREIRIIAGACSGGAALVVQGDGPLKSVEDFRNRQIGTPQLGNTQDIAARTWLMHGGLQIRLTGGDALVIPTANPDLYTLFKKKELDAVWTIEPWVSRLVSEAGGRVFLEESELWKDLGGRYATTLVTGRESFLNEYPDLAAAFLKAHSELTVWLEANPEEARTLVNDEFKEQTRRPLPEALLRESWKRIHLTTDPLQKSVERIVEDMRRTGFIRTEVDLGKLFHRVAPSSTTAVSTTPTPMP